MAGLKQGILQGFCVFLCAVIVSCDTHRYVSGSYDTRYHDMGYDVGYVSDWNSDWPMNGASAGRLNLQPKCVDIPSNMSLCRNIGYTRMRLPNLLDHDSLPEVTSQARQWVPLLGISCHPNTKLFLCSLFSPVCLDRPIFPCRSLCEEVKAGCEDSMMRYGYDWPEMLRCDKFPPDNDLCIGTQPTQAIDDDLCSECNQPDTFEAIIDNYCSADFVLRAKINDKVISSGETLVRVAKKKKKVYKKGNVSKRYFRNPEIYIKNGANCDCPVIDPSRKKNNYLIMGKFIDKKLVMTYAALFDRASKAQRKAFKEIRNEDTQICKSSLQELAQIMGDDGQVVEEDKQRKGNKEKRKRERKPKGNSDDNMDDRREQRRKERRERRREESSDRPS